MRLAIIGAGFVGSAVDYGFPSSATCEKIVIDPKLGTDISDLEGLDPDYIFICVPTPMDEDGRIDATIIRSVMAEVREVCPCSTIIVKSTVTPDIISSLSEYGYVVYNPEFLTEKSANEDFVNPSMHILGGHSDDTASVEELYKYHSLCKPCPVYHMSHIDASYVKYGVNTFLASKVLWFNQFFDIVESHGGNFGKIVGGMTADPRVGRSHTTVPGFDGLRGFSGSCFPKDSLAMVHYARDQKTPFTVLEEVVRQNQDYRNSQGGPTEREKSQNIRFDHEL